jgi:hypothetical protein
MAIAGAYHHQQKLMSILLHMLGLGHSNLKVVALCHFMNR